MRALFGTHSVLITPGQTWCMLYAVQCTVTAAEENSRSLARPFTIKNSSLKDDSFVIRTHFINTFMVT